MPPADSLALGKALRYASYSACFFISLIYVINLLLSFTIFIAFGLQSYYLVMSKVGYYENPWYQTNLKDYLRFLLFFLPERYFEDAKVENSPR